MIDSGAFGELSQKAFAALRAKEHLFLNLSAEESQFMRVSGSKVRQTGIVRDAQLSMTFVLEGADGLRRTTRMLSLTGLSYEDQQAVRDQVIAARNEASLLPVDPFAVLPQGSGTSRFEKSGLLLPEETVAEEILRPLEGLDAAGLYTSGPVLRAMAHSGGLFHWFSSESYFFDYSLYTAGRRAVKETLAGTQWHGERYHSSVEGARRRLAFLDLPPRPVERGTHRAYLSPAAVEHLITMFSWECMSEAAIRQGQSPLRKVRSGEVQFSNKFSLSEDFSMGFAPRFNEEGALAPERLALVAEGKLQNTIVSGRSAREYGIASNGGPLGEALRSTVMAPGTLSEEEILRELGNGIYLGNLHYLNWSDQAAGRVTGMTRYACLRVENGEITGPIEAMRFDDSIFSLFGSALEAVGGTQEDRPELSTYEQRAVAGMRVPGILLSGMAFTL